MTKYPRKQLKRRKGSELQRFQSMVTWLPCCVPVINQNIMGEKRLTMGRMKSKSPK
jgi:hypothetical protein